MQLLHIAHRADWEDACLAGTYTTSTRGATLAEVGFIHAATADQVDGVAHSFYRDDPAELVVLVIDVDAVRSAGTEIRHEDDGDGTFPHVYGPLDPAWITEVRSARFAGDTFIMQTTSVST